MALQGYVVVATDYAGLGVGKAALGKPIVHEYLAGPAQATDVVYSIQAARTAFPELSKDYVVIGSPEGGGAAWATLQKLPIEPMAGHLGSVALSPVTHVLSLSPNEEIYRIIALLLVPSIAAISSDFKLEDILTPEGK